VVSSSSPSVEELPGGEGVNFDSAAFGHFEEPSSFDRGHGGRNQNFNHYPGSLNAPTQAFATDALVFLRACERLRAYTIP